MIARDDYGAASPCWLTVAFVAGCSSPIITREQKGLIGAGLGAGTGAIIGSMVGHVTVGAVVGGPVRLIARTLIGDHFDGPGAQGAGAVAAKRCESARSNGCAGKTNGYGKNDSNKQGIDPNNQEIP